MKIYALPFFCLFLVACSSPPKLAYPTGENRIAINPGFPPLPPPLLTPAKVAATSPSAPEIPTSAPTSTDCETDSTSNLWNVKGISKANAYIVRTTDNKGLVIRLGMDVPGYGTAVSFNPKGRFVCTTFGKIERFAKEQGK